MHFLLMGLDIPLSICMEMQKGKRGKAIFSSGTPILILCKKILPGIAFGKKPQTSNKPSLSPFCSVHKHIRQGLLKCPGKVGIMTTAALIWKSLQASCRHSWLKRCQVTLKYSKSHFLLTLQTACLAAPQTCPSPALLRNYSLFAPKEHSCPFHEQKGADEQAREDGEGRGTHSCVQSYTFFFFFFVEK